jgi:hypothetical protein
VNCLERTVDVDRMPWTLDRPNRSSANVSSALSAMEEDDVEVVEVVPDGTSVLQVVLKIRIPSGSSRRWRPFKLSQE